MQLAYLILRVAFGNCKSQAKIGRDDETSRGSANEHPGQRMLTFFYAPACSPCWLLRPKKYRPSLCKPSFCRVGCVFHAEVYRFSSSHTCRWQRDPILAPLPPRAGQASAGARWRALDDSADGRTPEATGRTRENMGDNKRVPGTRNRRPA